MKKYEVVSPYVVFSVKDGAARKEYALKKGDTVELPENDIAVWSPVDKSKRLRRRLPSRLSVKRNSRTLQTAGNGITIL